GDYFAAAYRRDFVSWIDYRIGRSSADPLFSYYRCRYQRDPGWESGLRALYAGRRAGTSPGPPRTLVQQTQIIQQLSITNTTEVSQRIRQASVVAPLTRLADPGIKLRAVPASQQAE